MIWVPAVLRTESIHKLQKSRSVKRKDRVEKVSLQKDLENFKDSECEYDFLMKMLEKKRIDYKSPKFKPTVNNQVKYLKTEEEKSFIDMKI